MYVTKSISTGLYPNLDLWTTNKLQLQLQLHVLMFVMKTFTEQYLISEKEYMSVLPKTELTIRHLVVAICTNCCNIKKTFGYMVTLFL